MSSLKPFKMTFKDNEEERKLHELLSSKSSPMVYAKDILIEVLIRKQEDKTNGNKLNKE